MSKVLGFALLVIDILYIHYSYIIPRPSVFKHVLGICFNKANGKRSFRKAVFPGYSCLTIQTLADIILIDIILEVLYGFLC